MDAVPGRSCDQEVRFSRKEIFIMMKKYLNSSFSIILENLEKQLSEKCGYSINIDAEMKSALKTLFSKMKSKWQNVNRTEENFFKKFEEWLNESIAFRIPVATPLIAEKNTGGRPCKPFISASVRTKRRRTENIRTNFPLDTLVYATHMSLRAAGNLNAAKVVKDVTSASPTRAAQYRRARETKCETMLSGDAALSILIEQKLSKSQYVGLRAVSKENSCSLYPPYKTILQAKQQCYPPKMDIIITEYSAEVKLQSLLDQTAKRILKSQNSVIKSLSANEVSHMTLICKWGCDGSSGQSVYKQKFTDENKFDCDIFLTSLVPLQLLGNNQPFISEIVVWKNPRPSSPRFCRPIKIEFLHENTDATVREIQYIEEQIKTLVPLTTVVDGKEISISYKLAMTMIDGKVCNAVSSTPSTQRCYLCGATSKEFNNIDMMLQKEVNEDHLRFGLSTLHAWIRFFECCLHLSYRLDIKKWQIRTGEEKEIMKNRKAVIQKGFRSQLGLVVDRPKSGYGSSNDGNTARRFFHNAEVSASITGVDERLIKRFHVILQAVSSGHKIDIFKFKEYTIETAKKFVELYPWYCMPTSMHKLLIHAPQIITSALLPIGQMSEEAQEALHKYVKRFREDFSRKCSRIKTMEDVFLRLMVASDPYISSIRKLPTKKMKSLSPEAVKLLLSPFAPCKERQMVPQEEDSSEEGCDNEDDSDE